jgi:pilus assembly protein CpaE
MRAHELDPEVVEEVMISHPSGIRLLTAPRPEHAEQVKGEQFVAMLQYLRQIFPYVIVDTAHDLSEVNLATFEVSDAVVVPITQQIPTIADGRKFMDLAPLIHLNPKRILLVLNQFDKRVAITPEKIAQSFQREVAAVIPLETGTVLPSINRGQPFMLEADIMARPLGRAMLDLAEAVRAVLAQPTEPADEAGAKK